MKKEPHNAMISWFGWDMRDFELTSTEQFQAWFARLDLLVQSRGWRFNRLGNPIDFILEAPGRPISRKEFYDFQREFEQLNENAGFRFSAVLDLMDGMRQQVRELPYEVYVDGRVRLGESIGRPQRHRRAEFKDKPGKRETGKPGNN
jgi:hypothetical protein